MSTTTYTVVNGQVLRQSKDGVVSHFVSDPLGSVVMVRDNAGNTVYEVEYDPYGNVQSETGTNPSEFGYVGTLGYVKDSAFSLYVRARYLLTNLGRWLTKDPLWPSEPGFVYAASAPSQQIDPLGLQSSGAAPPCDGKHGKEWKTYCAAQGIEGHVPYSVTCLDDPSPQCPKPERRAECGCCSPGEKIQVCVGTKSAKEYTCPGGKPAPTPGPAPFDFWLCYGACVGNKCKGKSGWDLAACMAGCVAECKGKAGRISLGSGFYMGPSVLTGRPGIIVGWGVKY